MLAQLDTKTVYTFMDSMVTIEEYVKRAKNLGYQTIGIMDIHSLYAAYGFLEACQKEGLRPIIGCELDWKYNNGQSEILTKLIALSTKGYQNLMKISTAKMTGQDDFDSIRQFLQDIAVIVPFKDGVDKLDLGVNYYIGIYSDTPVQSFDHPVLPLHTVRYFQENQLESLQVLRAIKDNIPLNQVNEIEHQQVLLSAERLTMSFMDRYPQAISNLAQLVENVSYHLDKKVKLPRFNRQRPAVEELREKAQAGLVEKQLDYPLYQERLDKELAIIHQMGFDDYFLIVWDLLRFGRTQGYYMGMGRGSAVGSLVAYALNITGIDPVKHNLLFERFLNSERYSMPDIDIDIPDVHRSDFIRYVRDRYGTTHAAQIVTYSTFGAKQAIRDVFKRFGTPEYELTNITKKFLFVIVWSLLIRETPHFAKS